MTDYAAVLRQAAEAANKAQNLMLGPYHGIEPQLACGFAWVDIADPKHPFVKWCKDQLKTHGLKYDRAGNLCRLNGDFASRDGVGYEFMENYRDYGSPHYRRGWQFWGPGDFHGQWVDCKEAGADAFAAVLREYDIPATSGSRLD